MLLAQQCADDYNPSQRAKGGLTTKSRVEYHINMIQESPRGVESSQQKEVLMRAQALLSSVDADIKKLQEQTQKEEEQNTVEYRKHTGGRPREITGRELGAKIELLAAQKAFSLLDFAVRNADQEQSLSSAHLYKETLLDIAEIKIAPDKLDSIVIGKEGTQGLHGYFEEGMKLSERTLRYPQNPAIAMRVIPYLYQDRRRVHDYEHTVEQTLSKLKQGERALTATDLENVSIEYARVISPKEIDPNYKEERLQMSVVMDYLKK